MQVLTSRVTGRPAGAALERIDALHSALSRMVLEGGDLDRIAAEVAAGARRGCRGHLDRRPGARRAPRRRAARRCSRRPTSSTPPAGSASSGSTATGAPLGDGEVRVVRVAAAAPTWSG